MPRRLSRSQIARWAPKPKRGRRPVARHATMRTQKDCANRVFKTFQGHHWPGAWHFQDKYGVPQATAQHPALARSIANRVAALSKSLPPGTDLLAALYAHFGLTVGRLATWGSMPAAMQAAAPMYPPNHQAAQEIKQFAASVWQHTRAWGMANQPPGYGPHYTGMGSWSAMQVSTYTPSWMGQIILYQLVTVTPALDRCSPGPEMTAPRFGQEGSKFRRYTQSLQACERAALRFLQGHAGGLPAIYPGVAVAAAQQPALANSIALHAAQVAKAAPQGSVVQHLHNYYGWGTGTDAAIMEMGQFSEWSEQGGSPPNPGTHQQFGGPAGVIIFHLGQYLESIGCYAGPVWKIKKNVHWRKGFKSRFGQDEPMVQTMRIPVMAIGLGGTLGWLLARKR